MNTWNAVGRKRIDLGIAIAHATTMPGQRRSLAEIAAYCGCSRQNISVIEQKALRTLRRKLFMHNDTEVKELADHLFHSERKQGRATCTE